MEQKKPYKKFSGKGKTTLNSESLTLNQGRPEPKRRRLAPLMPEEAKATASIHELSYDFGCRITRLFQYLTEDAEYKEYVQSKQIYRSGTSIGANVRESKHAQSEADFLSKMSIAYKEADEVMEQREQSEACFDFAESRQNSTIVKLSTGLTCSMRPNILMIRCMIL